MKNTVLFFLSLVLAIVVAFLVATAERMFVGVKLIEGDEDDNGRKKFRFRIADAIMAPGQGGWIKAAAIGFVVGAINFFTPMIRNVIWLAPIFLLTMLGLMVYLMVWWHRDGSNWKEVLCFSVLVYLFYSVTRAIVQMMYILVKNVFWMSLIAKIPLILFHLCIGFFIVEALFFYCGYAEEKKAKLAHISAWVVKLLTILAIILILVFNVRWDAIIWGSNDSTTTDTQTTTKTTESVSWYGFYNLNMLKDEDPKNDYNFGPDPYEESKTA